jgi:valyl-tRNA synthetase
MKVMVKVKVANNEVFIWFENKLELLKENLEKSYASYRLSEALIDLYKFIWDDFCSWYLEFVKPPFGEKIDAVSYQKTVLYFEELMKLLHPFMPFISEEIYHHLHKSESESEKAQILLLQLIQQLELMI